MSDGVPTWDDVAMWLPDDVRRELEHALPAPLRGWLTWDEMRSYEGPCIESRSFASVESRYHPISAGWQERWPQP